MTQCTSCHSPNAEGSAFCRQCGERLPQVDPLLGSEILGRYRVTRLIGEGGMGRVYEAEQKIGTTQRRVAVKTLRPELCADAKLARRFFREAETIVRLTHPNLIQFFDFGEVQPGILGMVMEFIEGRSLAEELAQGPFDAARATRVLGQICGALEEAHALGIVHRDLKPDNILLTRRGGQEDFVKVVDFGIAKLSAAEDEASTKLTQQGMMVGTPPYMSPEQFSAENVDARSDIYSLGIIAYEMLTGRLPFDAKTPWEWASQHLTAEPAPIPTQSMPGVSEQHAAAIRRALSKRPAERPQRVSDFFSDFSAAKAAASADQPALSAAKAAVRAQETPQPSEAIQIPGTSKRGALWAAAAAVGLVGLLGLAWCLGDQADAPREQVAGVGSAPALPPSLPTAAAAAAAVGAAEQTPAAHTREAAKDTRNAMATATKANADESRSAQPATERRRETRVAPEQAPAALPATNEQTPAASSSRSRAAAPVGSPPPVASRPGAVSSSATAGLVTSTTQSKAASSGLSDSAEADLRSRIERGLALAPQRVETALSLYQAAAARYGAEQPALAPLRKALTEHGQARIRELLRANRCAQAQALLRALVNVGAAGSARSEFNAACPAG